METLCYEYTMRLVYIIRSYVGRVLEFDRVRIRPWTFAEVPMDEFKSLSADARVALERAKLLREITVQMVADNKPVDAQHETLVLQMKAEADKGGQSS